MFTWLLSMHAFKTDMDQEPFDGLLIVALVVDILLCLVGFKLLGDLIGWLL